MTAPTINKPTATAADTATCPDWCAGGCDEWSDTEGSRYHGSDFRTVAARSHMDGAAEIAVSATRLDEPGTESAMTVNMLIGPSGRISMDDVSLSPEQARILAAALVEAADNADPLPEGVHAMAARDLRLGDVILTDGGWQRTYMLIIDESADHVAAFTDERDDTDTDGWVFTLTDTVKVRRSVTR